MVWYSPVVVNSISYNRQLY